MGAKWNTGCFGKKHARHGSFVVYVPISTTIHWSYDPVVRELIGPTRQSEYATRSIGPMAH